MNLILASLPMVQGVGAHGPSSVRGTIRCTLNKSAHLLTGAKGMIVGALGARYAPVP